MKPNSTDLSKEFAAKLRALRKDRGYTQAYLAKISGVTRLTIIRLEKGENVGLNDICKVALGLDHTLSLAATVWPTWENAKELLWDGDDD